MSPLNLPEIPFNDWQLTYETLHMNTRALSAIRRTLTPRQKHWYHISLRVTANGLTTTPMPAGSKTLELQLDLTSHRFIAITSAGEQWQSPLRGESLAAFWKRIVDILGDLELHPRVDNAELFTNATPRLYDPAQVEPYWRALAQIDQWLKRFQGELRQETSPIQFWSHHFDLAMLWFSGRRVPGQDPADEEQSDEQMNFGFSPGDTDIPEPYFYVTAYPLPDGWLHSALPAPAQWHTNGWNGAVILYQQLRRVPDPAARLLEFWRTTQRAGARAMGVGA